MAGNLTWSRHHRGSRASSAPSRRLAPTGDSLWRRAYYSRSSLVQSCVRGQPGAGGNARSSGRRTESSKLVDGVSNQNEIDPGAGEERDGMLPPLSGPPGDRRGATE